MQIQEKKKNWKCSLCCSGYFYVHSFMLLKFICKEENVVSKMQIAYNGVNVHNCKGYDFYDNIVKCIITNSFTKYPFMY